MNILTTKKDADEANEVSTSYTYDLNQEFDLKPFIPAKELASLLCRQNRYIWLKASGIGFSDLPWHII